MRTFYQMMKKKKNQIPEEKLFIFDNIINTYFVQGRSSNEGDNKFCEALDEHFTQEERFRLYEQMGGCSDSRRNKARKVFAAFHADKPLAMRLDLYFMEFENSSGKTLNIGFNEKNKTITYTFACDECYKHSLDGKITAPFALKYEGCAGARLRNLQTALGIKLKIAAVNIPEQGVSKETPCVFTFAILE